MQRAVEGMYKERRHVFRQFATGLFTLLFAVIFGGWLKMKPEPALATTGVVLYGMWQGRPSGPFDHSFGPVDHSFGPFTLVNSVRLFALSFVNFARRLKRCSTEMRTSCALSDIT